MIDLSQLIKGKDRAKVAFESYTNEGKNITFYGFVL